MAVVSPCINVCRMDETSGLCTGCWRTLEEIAVWSKIDDARRSEILVRVDQRRADWGVDRIADRSVDRSVNPSADAAARRDERVRED